jgi:hypothetical protein
LKFPADARNRSVTRLAVSSRRESRPRPHRRWSAQH